MSSNYRKYAMAAYPHQCNRCQYADFPEILEVHHIDRDRTNNELENLEILCPNCHQVEHLLNSDGRFWFKQDYEES